MITAAGANVHVAIRPERARLTAGQPADGVALHGTVRQVFYLGATHEVHVDFASGGRGFVQLHNDGDGTDVRVEPGGATPGSSLQESPVPEASPSGEMSPAPEASPTTDSPWAIPHSAAPTEVTVSITPAYTPPCTSP